MKEEITSAISTIALFTASAALSIIYSNNSNNNKKTLNKNKNGSFSSTHSDSTSTSVSNNYSHATASYSYDEDEDDEETIQKRREEAYFFQRSRSRLSFDHIPRFAALDSPRHINNPRRKYNKSHYHFESPKEKKGNLNNGKSYSLDSLIEEEKETNNHYGKNNNPLDFLSDNNPNNNNNNNGSNEDIDRFAVWRSNYNSEIMPDKIIMVRHGQSEGNVNEELYKTQPDNNIRLTKLGWDQAKMAGQAIRNQILNNNNTTNGNSNNTTTNKASVHFIVSPYVRTIETFHGLAHAWSDPTQDFGHIQDLEIRKAMWYKHLTKLGVTWHEDPRIREQDFGNFQNSEVMKKCKSERHKFGVFYYRFPNGESASDVYDRVSTFLDSLWRSFDANRATNYILVTHGISIRVLLARYFRYSIDQFNMLANPKNCEMVILGHDGNGKLQLNGRCELLQKQQKKDKKEKESNKEQNNNEEEDSSNNIQITGVKFHKKLRIVPETYIRTRTVRLSYD